MIGGASRRTLLALTVAGVVAGHFLAYILDPEQGHAAAAHHRYWPIATVIAVAAGLAGTLWLLVPHVRQGGIPRPRVIPVAMRLAVLQVGLFLGIEVMERAVSGGEAAAFLGTSLAWIGAAMQVAVAVAVAVMARALAGVAEALGVSVGARRSASPTPRLRPVQGRALRPQVLVGAGSMRGPPSSLCP